LRTYRDVIIVSAGGSGGCGAGDDSTMGLCRDVELVTVIHQSHRLNGPQSPGLSSSPTTSAQLPACAPGSLPRAALHTENIVAPRPMSPSSPLPPAGPPPATRPGAALDRQLPASFYLVDFGGMSRIDAAGARM
jgi:hypothetical protein